MPEQSRDRSGKTPLHVAVAYGCRPAIANLLLSSVAGALPACAKDVSNRYPLHWACASKKVHCPPSMNLFTRNKKDKEESYKVMVSRTVENVAILLHADPHSCAIRDSRGDTPLDLARRNKVDSGIIETLLKYYVVLNPIVNNFKICHSLETDNETEPSLDCDGLLGVDIDTIDDHSMVSSVGWDTATTVRAPRAPTPLPAKVSSTALVDNDIDTTESNDGFFLNCEV
jgi:hypothetical protein